MIYALGYLAVAVATFYGIVRFSDVEGDGEVIGSALVSLVWPVLLAATLVFGGPVLLFIGAYRLARKHGGSAHDD